MQTNKILNELSASYKVGNLQREVYVEYMSLMYRMIGHTRDIIDGKGEYTLSYMLLEVWYNYNPELAKFAFRHFLLSPEGKENVHPYGSWKDIKKMYDNNKLSPLVQYGSQLLLNQLYHDAKSDTPSLAAKWVPREKSKYGDLFTILAMDYFPDYLESAKTHESRQKAIIKSKMEFRKLISKINMKLDTVQIKQCSNDWSSIDPSKQTSLTMHKQKKAFLNLKMNGQQRSSSEDRMECANILMIMPKKLQKEK